MALVVLVPPQGHDNIPVPLATPPPLPPGASIPSDRSYKLDLIAKMPKPPQLIIFGDSRAQRFEPAQFEQLTGLRTFNAAFSNGRPLEAWAYVNYLLLKYPDVTPRVFWAIQPTSFYDKPIDPGLVQDPRLTRWFDQGFVDKAAQLQVASMNVPKPMLWYPAGYAADGHVVHNWYDDLAAGGRTLEQGIRQEVGAVLSRSITPYHRKSWSRNQTYMAATLGLLNSVGVAPLMVVMPTHPLGIELLGRARWEAQRTRFRDAMALLHRRYRFTLLDFSELKSFKGDPSGFYDAIHIRAENARLIAEAAVKQAPAAFEPIGTPAFTVGSVAGPPAAGTGRE